MPRERDKKYNEPLYCDVIAELPDDETFIIGQIYESEAVTTISCKLCGNTSFNVGVGSHYTAIKCTKCDWQICVHDG